MAGIQNDFIAIMKEAAVKKDLQEADVNVMIYSIVKILAHMPTEERASEAFLNLYTLAFHLILSVSMSEKVAASTLHWLA